jgi:hypothetical protein
MKNLVALFAVLFLFAFTSCSDVNDNSLLTNPVMEKSSSSGYEITPTPFYPYSYLFNFSKVEGLKYLNLEEENAVEFYMTEGTRKYVHLFVVVTYIQDISPKMYFIDNIHNETFKVQGINLNQIQKIEVYGLPLGYSTQDVAYPFTNNSVMNEVAVNGWKLDNSSVVVECAGTWPSSLKYIFAEIITKDKSFFVFLQRPWSTKFVIPEYGKYGVEGIRLFGYQTVMEATVAQN